MPKNVRAVWCGFLILAMAVELWGQHLKEIPAYALKRGDNAPPLKFEFVLQGPQPADVNWHNLRGKVVVLDLRKEDPIYPGNRFMIYALNPDSNVSIHVMWGVQKQNTVLAIGKSIFNRTSALDIGSLCLNYGGGGHKNAGTCQVANEDADRVQTELIERLTAGESIAAIH